VREREGGVAGPILRRLDPAFVAHAMPAFFMTSAVSVSRATPLTSALPLSPREVQQCDIDLLHPPAALEAQRHKLKRLVQSPNSFFMDVKCQVRLSEP
jgi:hypothetical protein